MDEVWIIRGDAYDWIGDIYAVYNTYEDALHDFKVLCKEMCAKIQDKPWDNDKKNSQFAIATTSWHIILEPVQFV